MPRRPAAAERLCTSEVDVATFSSSMPEAYRASFDADAVEDHAAIVARRGSRATHVEIWRELPERVVAVLVVADDQPGFLAKLSAALLAHAIDVVEAHAYGRQRDDGAVEAVDVLWVRRLGPSGTALPLRSRDLACIGDLVDALVCGAADLDDAVESAAASELPEAATRVTFAWDEAERVTVLTIEATDRPGLLLAVTKTLFAEGLQIVGLRAQTEARGSAGARRAVDRFSVVERDGTPVKRERLLQVQIAVLSAIDGAPCIG